MLLALRAARRNHLNRAAMTQKNDERMQHLESRLPGISGFFVRQTFWTTDRIRKKTGESVSIWQVVFK
ncbi:hypothetical protein QR680_008100 [Steinernema hermaphroditum]|uniref:Uncharacterized protein n=1 Tax=Steinernema hermaphroditum TaxID=289476 RepID=A0AA39IFC9_9BILA|nr:hypothetical protein QR680_008100 [Steinernema hermaphroditum]